MAAAVNIRKWINDNTDQFSPPVCNRMLHEKQLKVFLVGGPNMRLDYHLNEGEEFFYMIRGDMCLKVIEGGKHNDIVIKEGHSFLLPARVPHSPQRYADTVGLVVERERMLSELDGIRFYASDSSQEIIFERWFHCHDLGSQLKPLILQFFNSVQYRTSRQGPDSQLCKAPYEDDAKARLPAPVNTHAWLREKLSCNSRNTFTPLFFGGFASLVGFYGPGGHVIENHEWETMLLQFAANNQARIPASLRLLSCSSSTLSPQDQETGDQIFLHVDDCIILPTNSRWRLDNDPESGVTLAVCMPPP